MGSIASSIGGGAGLGAVLGSHSPLGLAGTTLGAGVGNGIEHGFNINLGDPLNAQMPGAAITQGATQGQFNQLYDQQQGAIKQQQDFTNALGAAYQGLPGQQMQLNQQLQGVANGTGPNPAMAALNQATGQNVANQAALMGSQRGAGANVGLMARQAGMQGAGIQQQAVGQGATMQAQQQLAAMSQLGGQQAQMLGAQQAAQNANQAGITGAQGNINNSIGNWNNAQANLAGASAQIESGNAQRRAGLIGSLTGGIGAAMGLAEGGVVPSKGATIMKGAQAGFNAMGGWDGQQKAAQGEDPMTKLGSAAHSYLQAHSTAPPAAMAGGPMDNMGSAMPASGSRLSQFFSGGGSPPMALAAKGGMVPALVSPGERYLSPEKVERVKAGANPMKEGETIPGKAKVAGAKNDYANDTVPRTLQEGGIVLPRSVTQAKDADKRARAFCEAVLSKKR